MADRSCSTCVYNSGNECRRHPPVLCLSLLDPGRTNTYKSMFPNVHPSDKNWCGEYEAKPDLTAI